MALPLPQEEIAPLMRFIAEKVKNVKSPMSVRGLAVQFKEETGAWMSINGLKDRVLRHRHKIHEMKEFDMETKVKMMFALSAPIDAEFLIEMKKVADVEVDNQRRIISYKQKDGGLELSAKYLRLSINQGEQRDRETIQLLAEKSKATEKLIPDRVLLREFKRKNGYTDSIDTLGHRLREDADVEVDEEGRITKYKSRDGSLELEGSHEMSSITKSIYSDRWHTACEKVNKVVSEKDDEEDSSWQKDFERKRIDLVRFLIHQTKNATCPLNINQLANDYKKEFKSSEQQQTTTYRIRSFRQRIHEMNQFDTSAKVKMMFALSASIDADFLKDIFGDSEFDFSQPLAAVPKGRKRAREFSEEDDDGKPLKVKDDSAMGFDTNNAEDFDYDPSSCQLEMDCIPIENKPETLIEVKTEEPSTTIVGNHYEDNLFDYDREGGAFSN